MGPTLGDFIAETYEPWAGASRPRAAANPLEKLQRLFGSWFSEPLTGITLERIESWKARRFPQRVSATTVLRDLFSLSSVLSRAVKVGKLSENLSQRADKPRIDRRPKVRFLDDAEETRLRDALSARDREFLQVRQAYNVRRQERGEGPLPIPSHFYDHLTPAVLLSMNTGLRRGELLKLNWCSIDFARQWLTVEGGTSKTRQTRHVPLNDEAISLLNRWREQSGGGERVFTVCTGFKTAWAKLLKRAGVAGMTCGITSLPASCSEECHSMRSEISWATARWPCRCVMRTWRPISGAKRSRGSMPADSFRCAGLADAAEPGGDSARSAYKRGGGADRKPLSCFKLLDLPAMKTARLALTVRLRCTGCFSRRSYVFDSIGG
jgi:integrase